MMIGITNGKKKKKERSKSRMVNSVSFATKWKVPISFSSFCSFTFVNKITFTFTFTVWLLSLSKVSIFKPSNNQNNANKRVLKIPLFLFLGYKIFFFYGTKDVKRVGCLHLGFSSRSHNETFFPKSFALIKDRIHTRKSARQQFGKYIFASELEGTY